MMGRRIIGLGLLSLLACVITVTLRPRCDPDTVISAAFDDMDKDRSGSMTEAGGRSVPAMAAV
jgi:hypothetical protein